MSIVARFSLYVSRVRGKHELNRARLNDAHSVYRTVSKVKSAYVFGTFWSTWEILCLNGIDMKVVPCQYYQSSQVGFIFLHVFIFAIMHNHSDAEV